jgi:hypothetical protein
VSCGSQTAAEGRPDVHVHILAEQGTAPDCFQRPLLHRSRFQQQVSASVSHHYIHMALACHVCFMTGDSSVHSGAALGRHAEGMLTKHCIRLPIDECVEFDIPELC